MNLEKSCKEGKMGIEEFFEFIVLKIPRRTHFLDVGNYVVLAHPYKKDHVDIEKIAKLNSPERGDFETIQGTIGPISGNVFIKIDKKQYPGHFLIEGDKTGEPTCPVPVYDLVNEYLKSRCNRN